MSRPPTSNFAGDRPPVPPRSPPLPFLFLPLPISQPLPISLCLSFGLLLFPFLFLLLSLSLSASVYLFLQLHISLPIPVVDCCHFAIFQFPLFLCFVVSQSFFLCVRISRVVSGFVPVSVDIKDINHIHSVQSFYRKFIECPFKKPIIGASSLSHSQNQNELGDLQQADSF